MNNQPIKILIFVAIIGSTGCQQQKTTNSVQIANSKITGETNGQWNKYVEGFLNDYFVARPDFAVYQGKQEYDGKFPDWSEEGLTREIARMKSEFEKAAVHRRATRRTATLRARLSRGTDKRRFILARGL